MPGLCTTIQGRYRCCLNREKDHEIERTAERCRFARRSARAQTCRTTCPRTRAPDRNAVLGPARRADGGYCEGIRTSGAESSATRALARERHMNIKAFDP